VPEGSGGASTPPGSTPPSVGIGVSVPSVGKVSLIVVVSIEGGNSTEIFF